MENSFEEIGKEVKILFDGYVFKIIKVVYGRRM